MIRRRAELSLDNHLVCTRRQLSSCGICSGSKKTFIYLYITTYCVYFTNTRAITPVTGNKELLPKPPSMCKLETYKEL